MSRRSFYGWLELIIGILLIVFGIFTVIHPNKTMTWVVVIYGIIAILTGIADIVFYVKTDHLTGFGPTVSLISGIFSVMAGCMLLVHPDAGSVVMVLLIPIWFIAHCIAQLSHLPMIRFQSGDFYYYFTLIANIIGLVLGVMMIFEPYLSFIAAGFIIGAYLIVTGAHMVSLAISNLR